MKKVVFLCSVFILTVCAAYAEEAGSFFGAGDEETPQADVGVVLVEDKEPDVQTGVDDCSRSTALLQGDAISAQAGIEAVDVLRQVPGIIMEKSSALAFGQGSFAPSVLRIRGMGATPNSGILLLVDGRPQFAGVFRHPLFDSVMLGQLQSIEVIKGPSGTLYGNMAAAGVINIKTRKLENDGLEVGLNTALGTHYLQDHSASVLFRQEDIDVSGSVGYSSYGGERPNSDSYIEDIYGHAGYRMDDTLYASFNGNYSYARSFNPGPQGINWPRDAESVVSFERNADFRIEYDGGDHKATYMILSDVGSNRFLASAARATYTASGWDFAWPGNLIEHEDYGARMANEWVLLPGNSTKAGFDWNYFSGFYENWPNDAAKKALVTARENEYAPYVLASQSVGIFGISAGYRYAFNTVWGWEGVPHAGFKISFFDGHYVYLNASKGYKTPAMGQLLYAGYDGLNPESFWQYELGTTHTLMDKVDYKVALYQTEGQNMIKVTGAAPVQEAVNSGFMLIRGVEASIDARPLTWMNAGVSATYNDPREKTAGSAFFSGAFYLKASLAGFNGSLTGNFARDRFDGDNRTLKLGDYFTMDLGLSYATRIAGKETSFFVDVTNLLNAQYDVRYGYPADGFNVRGGVGVKL